MELLMAIAMLCQVSAGGAVGSVLKHVRTATAEYQLDCQQTYINCVAKRRATMKEQDALEKCILEKK